MFLAGCLYPHSERSVRRESTLVFDVSLLSLNPYLVQFKSLDTQNLVTISVLME